MMRLDSVETPAVLIDEDIAHANIRAYQNYCERHGLALRPHIKTHKLPRFAKAQLDAGAVGVTCQKISEAEVMANHGIDDIFITYNLLGAEKLQRLANLAMKTKRLAVVADNAKVVDGLAHAFASTSPMLTVLVECDTGAGRCGVQTPAGAVRLAEQITKFQSLNFGGLMTYPAIGGGEQVQNFMETVCADLDEKNILCPIISSGGTPDMWRAHTVSAVTEYRVGTYIYNDRSLVDGGVCQVKDCALTVLATVVSTPTPERAVIDAGSKVLTSDLNGLEHYGIRLEHPELAVAKLSEEHGVLQSLTGGSTGLSVGERVRIIPNHACVVSNMVDAVVLHRNGKRPEIVEVSARGCVT